MVEQLRGDQIAHIDYCNINPDKFAGTIADLANLNMLVRSIEFQQAYPHHVVYIFRSHVVGAHPNEATIGPEGYRRKCTEQDAKLQSSGINPRACAIVQTSKPRVSRVKRDYHV